MARQSKAAIDRMELQNAIKTLAANIRFASVDNPIRSIVLTSSVPNEGKTTIAVQLAQAFAAGGKSVLLVETDMRRRSLANVLKLRARFGLHAVLSGQAQLADAVLASSVPGLYFLDAEPHIPNPEVLLGSKRFRSFLDRALESFDYVLFDTPPVTAFVDAAVLAAVADGTLLVVGQNVVRRDDLASAREQLKKANANVLGAVMNFCNSSRNEYYHEYYTDNPDLPAAEPAPAVPAAPARPTRRAERHTAVQAHAQTHANAAAPAQPGLKPLAGARGGAAVSPSSTAQFMVNADASGIRRS